MGCDIHLKLEWRYKEPKKKLIREAEYDDDGNLIVEAAYWNEGTEWRGSTITRGGNEWGDRIYGMFARLADVRNYGNGEHLPIRGFPDDACYDTKNQYAYYRVFDTKEEVDRYNEMSENWDGRYFAITAEEAEKYTKNGWCEQMEVEGKKRMSCPDWHSANWCSTKEFEKCVKDLFLDKDGKSWKGDYAEWLAILGAMKGYEMDPDIECRAVFWFDN